LNGADGLKGREETMQETQINVRRLFVIGVIALFTSALSFSMRAALAGDIKASVFDVNNPAVAGELIGSALAIAFLSFAITTIVVSPLLDKVGMKNTLICAALCFICGSIFVSLGHFAPAEVAYRTIWLGMLLTGIGWGCTEGTINPMTTAIYPDDKTHRLNVLHAWWPAGLIIGGLLGYFIGKTAIPWYISILVVVIPSLIFLVMLRGQSFPKTGSAQLGVSTIDMITEVFKSPSFLVWFAIMFLTAATELAPGQWVDIALTHVVGMRGILLLVFVSGIMFVMRHFAGPIAHRISSVGLMLGSSVLALAGLLLLSSASNPFTAVLAAAVWGMGVCFMWPTMMAIAADRYPRAGAWAIGLIASAGALAIFFVLPQLGAIYDRSLAEAAGGMANIARLGQADLLAAQAKAATSSFEVVALFPAILVVVFGAIMLLEKYTRRRLAASA
jgi:MFS family permease